MTTTSHAGAGMPTGCSQTSGERSWWNWKSGFCNPSATSRDVIEKYMSVLEKWHLLNGVSFAGYRVSNEE